MADEVTYLADNDYYSLFDISPAASPDEISKAHKRLAKECHPDLHPDKEWATERFKEINRAYEVLKNPDHKGVYDRLRWEVVGKDRQADRARPSPAIPPKGSSHSGDPDRHHKDRMMSYFILGIEVAVMLFFLVLVTYRALTKHKF